MKFNPNVIATAKTLSAAGQLSVNIQILYSSCSCKFHFLTIIQQLKSWSCEGRHIMGPFVRLIGSGIGLASEAIASHKAEKAKATRSTSPAPPTPNGGSEETPPPAYTSAASVDLASAENGLVEVHDDKQAREVIDKGQAVTLDHPPEPVDEEEATQAPECDEDEAYWELDEESAPLEASISTEAEGTSDEEPKPDVKKLLQQFLSAHLLSSGVPSGQGRLPCPVVTP